MLNVHLPDDASRQVLTDTLGWVEAAAPGMGAQDGIIRTQKRVLAAFGVILVLAFVFFPVGTACVVAGVFSLVYLGTVAHRCLIFYRSIKHADVVNRVADDEARAYPDELLPVYTVLIPAYGEPEVVPELLASLELFEYPRHKLEIKLLLEECDPDTLAAAMRVETDLNVDVLVVPDGLPRTKPRALNYGLSFSTGELVTIYDAEDRPDPLQLRRAAIAFSRLGPEWACIQARLNFYDSNRNLLTKWFAAEYSTWFACYLPGLVATNGIIPLGGTSNHFRREPLVEAGAWDAYNVTEDADLGIRLQRRGYRIGVLDSVTLEEPNADVVNWVKQRSRWQKGYLLTALVHLRHPVQLYRDLGPRAFLDVFLFILGTPLLAFSNPVFWLLAVVWLVAQPDFILHMFPGLMFHVAASAWALGNLAIMYLTVSTLIVVNRDDLLIPALLTPIYWVLMSIAGIRATVQLFTDPFYWEKTAHGLHQSADGADVVEDSVIDVRDGAVHAADPAVVRGGDRGRSATSL